MDINKKKHLDDEFLKGPNSRLENLRFVYYVASEFLKAFRIFHFAGPCITIFGSARFPPDHQYYQLTRKMAYELGRQGFTIMTGGGPGAMEAANRGAQEADALSLGCNIILDHEQEPNPYIDKYVVLNHFFVRKNILRKYSLAFVVMPGGFGTLDEFFESVTLIQTGKLNKFPIVVMDTHYHRFIMEHIEVMVQNKTISPHDLDLILFTDDINEAVDHILNFVRNRRDETIKTAPRPLKILGEKKITKAAHSHESVKINETNS
jgi:uncharacterized protein (TIGR00730 family)